MDILNIIYLGVLFFLLVPGILVTLPKSGSKWTVALLHSLIFVIVFTLTHKFFDQGRHPVSSKTQHPTRNVIGGRAVRKEGFSELEEEEKEKEGFDEEFEEEEKEGFDEEFEEELEKENFEGFQEGFEQGYVQGFQQGSSDIYTEEDQQQQM
jgi:hypothetical protein